MPDSLQNPFAFIGRLLIASLFLPAGIGKITGFAGTVGYIASAGLPLPTVAAVIAIIVEVLGSLALIVGCCTRLAALAMAIFTLAACFSFHAYWAAPAAQVMSAKLMFFKDIAIAGGLLTVAAWGAGAWSMDARRR
ncbi:DoxX family protein [Leeia oryzae]|uniref:DoxX family protein n=1 Tax=Leeia oryzae TaxID=356662 RepID=UPI00035C7AFF|nr:DoxX family protein [Leeia oryzae]